MTTVFTKSYTALPEHIDELEHVNNAVWVQWVQDLATSHWAAVADPAHVDAYYWVVVRHEIDYRGNIVAGDSVTGTTWIEEPPRGATSLRRIEFRDAAGKVIVAATTTWAMMDRASGRLSRVRPEVIAPFLMNGAN